MRVTIDDKELDRLYRNSVKLECLISAGIDNWEGYDDAMQTFIDLEKENFDNAKG